MKRTVGCIGYEYVYFPFEGEIKFWAPNNIDTKASEYIFKFIISEKGSWKISVNI